MMSPMVSCVAIYRSPTMQQVKCMSNASNLCPHSHMRRFNVEGSIKSKWKHNVQVKVECAMQNEDINDLAINHSLAPLPKQEWMWVLDAKEMESSSKIDIRDVSWWMSIKYTCSFVVSIITKLSKKRCISLAIEGRSSHTTHKHDWSRCGPPST